MKQIMEEAVTRKFVHEDSSHIISFCGESVARGLKQWLLPLWAALGRASLSKDSHIIILLCNLEGIFGSLH